MKSMIPFLAPAAMLCAFMAIVMAFRSRSRGASAWALSVAFLILGVCLLLIEYRAPLIYIALGGVALIGCLIADFALRSGQRGEPKP